MVNKYTKRCATCHQEMQIKIIIIAHLLEGPKSVTLIRPNAGKNVEQLELSLLVGKQNGTATLEDSLVVFYKIKHILNI